MPKVKPVKPGTKDAAKKVSATVGKDAAREAGSRKTRSTLGGSNHNESRQTRGSGGISPGGG